MKGFHFIQSFKPGETTPEQAHQIGCEFIERCFGNDFEVVIGTHTDRAHIHNHIIVNSVSFVDGHKYRSTPQTLYELRSISDELCREHGLSVIDNPRVKAGKHYAEWKAEKEGSPTMRGMIREDIDVIVSQARTLDEFWEMLRGRGYEIRLNERRKYVTIRHPNGERFIRLKSLGDEYTPRQLAARIEAQRGSVAPVSYTHLDSEFRYASRPIPALGEMDRAGRVVYVNTFAKSLSPALRIGYLVLPDALMARYRERFSLYSSTVPSFDQHTLAAFMRTGG